MARKLRTAGNKNHPGAHSVFFKKSLGSMQAKYFELVKKICREANIQILLATHSSVFVDEQTIKDTYRFFKTGNQTRIVAPVKIEHPEKELIKILTFTNSSRIFFAEDVVLVEGDTDEFFLECFMIDILREKLNPRGRWRFFISAVKGTIGNGEIFWTCLKSEVILLEILIMQMNMGFLVKRVLILRG